MRPGKKSKSVDTTQVSPYNATIVASVAYDYSTPQQPVIETFFLGTYLNPTQSEKGTRLFYSYFDLWNEDADTLDLVNTEVDLDHTKKLQLTDHDPNKPPGERKLRNFPERWVSNVNPAAGHIPNVHVTGGADSASGTLDP